jgi:hypothetical protein
MKFKSNTILNLKISGLANRQRKLLGIEKFSGQILGNEVDIISAYYPTRTIIVKRKSDGVILTIWNDWITDIRLS